VKEVHMTTTDIRLEAPAGRCSVFDRVLVGVDGSDEAREAARQAAVLSEGPVTLLAAYTIATLVGGTGAGVPVYYDEELQRRTAEHALEQAWESIGGHVSAKVVRGTSWDELVREVDREHDTLVAVGSHGQGRARGIVVGSTATGVVHKAPCSVLVTRAAGVDFPNRIVVGIDGSPESAAAYATARALGDRFGSRIWPVVAHGGKSVDKRLVSMILDHHREDSPDEPVQALVAASADADLVIVGSRGLHGLRSLGSVSERVAHEAGCSVLVVRESPWQRIAHELGG
jgi:nucleotide-binding universal stress UspA family protein